MMAFSFPVSLEVAGRRCVVFGSGPVARARAEALLDAGAAVTAVARPHEDGDLAGAFLAVAATGDAAETARIFAEAEREGVLLNAVDDPAHCHFAVPAVLRRGVLLDLIAEVRAELRAQRSPDADFNEWARRWRDALDHDLIGLVRAGRAGEARTLLRAALAEDEYKEAVA